MTDLDPEKINNLVSAIDEVSVDEITELPFEFFDKSNNRTTKLISNSPDNRPVEGRHRWFDYKLLEPAFVTKVTTRIAGYSDFHEFDFKWTDANGREKNATGKVKGDSVEVEVNDLCRRFSFRPPAVFFSNPSILSVKILGIEAGNVAPALDRLSHIEAYKAEIIEVAQDSVSKAKVKVAAGERAEAERSAVQREMSQHKSSIARLKKSIDDLSRQKNELIAQNAAADDSLKMSQSRLNGIDSEYSRISKAHSEKIKEIDVSKQQLKVLQEDINLFPSEISGFVNQGSKNIKQYVAISSVPIAIIVVMFVLLVRGAADLTTVVTEKPNVNIQTLMISRIPYVIVAGTIITACYKIARVFIAEIMKINTQRLSLTKLSIIAKDVSSSAEYDLDLNDVEIYKLRTEFKMQLLKDHLKEYLSRDFTIELPTRLLGIIPIGRERVSAKVSPDQGHSEAD